MGGTRSQASGEGRAGRRVRSWWVVLLCLLVVGAGGASASVETAAAQGTNADPAARDNAYRVKKDNTLRVSAPGVLRNDQDPDGDGLSAARASSPGHGRLTLRGGGSFVYTPDRGYRGKDSFAYRATDGMGGTDTATVEITVWSPERPPLARNDAYGMEEDGTLTVPAPGVLKNDAEADGRRLLATKVSDPGHGSLSLNRNGSFVYAPEEDYNGEDSFVYRARGGGGRSDKGVVRISVGAVNDAPVYTGAAGNTSQTIDERSGLSALEATDVDGDPLTFELTGGSLPPGITLRDDGGFDGAAGGRAADDYTANIDVSDGNGGSATTELGITVNRVEEAAVAEDVDATTDEDDPETITLSATDADSDDLTFSTSSPDHGTLGSETAPDCSTPAGTTACTATVVYTPEADYNGEDSFTYTAGDSEPATVGITVNPVNDAPTVAFDSAPSSADEGGTKTFDFTVTDPDAGDPFTVKSGFPDCGTGGVQVGETSTNVGGGSFECRFPDGPASPNVRVQVADAQDVDSNAAGQPVAVANVKPSISLSGPNEANEGETKTYNFTVTDPGTADTHDITTGCGTGNKSNYDYNPQTKAGSFDCTFPDGPETTNVTATAADSDGAADTDGRRVEVTVENVAPTAQDVTQTTGEDTEKTITLAATDPVNDPLTFNIVSLPANGTLHEGTSSGGSEITSPGAIPGDRVTYKPDADYNGSDSFTYKANDGNADSNTATAAITVGAVNDAPVNTVPQGSLATGEGEDLNITGISVDDVDAGDNDVRTVLGVTGGTLTLDTGVQNGATAIDNGTGSVTLTGTVAEINATLGAGVTYNSVAGGSFTLTVETDDGGNTGSGDAKKDTDTVAIVVDAAPAVTTTSPSNDATDVALGADITVNFSEPVDVGLNSFEIKCPETGTAGTFTITGSGTNSVTLNPDNDLPGATECQVRVVAGRISDVDANDPPDNMAADHTFTFTTVTKVIDDDYSNEFTVIGNVRFDSQDASPSFGVLGNDEVGASTEVTSAGWQGNAGKTERGGDVTVRAGGTFEYNPPAGYEGPDRFTYTISGGSVATVTLKVGGTIWFVDENATTSGDGRLSSPYDTLSAFNTANNPAAGESVFLYESNDDYAGGITLLNGQTLVGQDASQSLAQILGLTPPDGSDPLPATDGGTPDAIKATVVNFDPGGNGITLAEGNAIRGLTVGSTPNGSGVKATNVNNATMGADVAVFGANGVSAVEISGGNGTIDYNGTIENFSTNARSVSVADRTGGAVNLDGNISGSDIAVYSNTGGAVNFTGTSKVISNGQVALSNNAGTTINFTGGGLDVDLDNSSGSIGSGFIAQNGGTLNVTGPGNRVATTGDAAVVMSSVNLGANGATFGNVTSSGGDTGVRLASVNGGGLVMNGGSLSNTGQRTFEVSGGNANITYAGVISNNNKGGISVQDRTGGTVTFSGNSKTLNTGTNDAVLLSGAGTVNFTNGGLDIDTTSGTGFAADDSSTTVNVTGTGNTINSTGGTAVNMSGVNIGASGVDFDGTTSGGGTNNVLLTSVGTGGTFDLGSGTLSGASGDAFKVVGGNGSVSYAGNISNASSLSILAANIQNKTGGTVTLSGNINPNNPARGISVSGNTGGTTVNFSGASKRISAGTAATGVSLTNNGSNGGATVNFTGGGLEITGANNAVGFNATGGGTVTVRTGTNANTINTVAGTALKVENTTIGSDGLNFRSISAGTSGSGPANGIVLNSTGSSGGLTVTGNDGDCTIANPTCTGGTIQNTAGDGVSLTNTNGPSFARLQVKDTAGHGISGTTTSGLNLSNSLVRGAGDADNETGLYFASVNGTNLTGNSSITNTVVHAPADVGAFIQNYGGTLNLTVSGSTFSGTQKNTTGVVTGEDLVHLNADRTGSGSATITAKFIGSTFKDSERYGLAAFAQSSTGSGGGTMNLTADNNTFNGEKGGVDCPNGCNDKAIVAQAEQGGTLRFTIQNNNVQNHRNEAIFVLAEDTSSAQGTIQSNTIGTAGVERSGSYLAQGIFVAPDGSADVVAQIHNNTIRSTHWQGIWAEANDGGGGTPKMDVILTNNSTPTPSQSQGTYLPSIDVQSTTNANVCAKVEGNTAQAGRSSAGSVDFLLYRDTSASAATFKIEGLPSPTADASAYVKGKNPASADPVYAFASSFDNSPVNFTTGTCRTPAATPTP